MDMYPSLTLVLTWLCLATLSLGAEVSRKGHRSFSDSLVSLLYTNDNDCTSTWGVSLMLDLLRPGGTPATQEELCEVVSLCLDEQEQQQLLWSDTVTRLGFTHDGSCTSQYTSGLTGEVECFGSAPTLKVANSVWITTGRALDPNYQQVVGQFLQTTDFASEAAAGVVNDWVNASTNGLIDSILPQGPIPYDLVAINSIYLKAAWVKTFAERFTNEDVFYTNSMRETVLPEKVNFMHSVEYFACSETAIPGYQIVQLPYQENVLSMILVLPTVAGAPPVTSASVVTAVSSLEEQRVALALPKFTYDTKYQQSLKDGLKALGLLAPFSQAEGFCSLFQNSCQFLDLVIQKTFINVNELGTEAAAVTAGATSTSVPIDVPVLYMADHPFQFFIYDRTEDLCLFEGQVSAPPLYQEEAQIQKAHADADFWTSNFGVDPTLPLVQSLKPTMAPPTPQPTTETSGQTPQPTPGGTPQPTPMGSQTPQPTPSLASRNVNYHAMWTVFVAAIIFMIS